MAFEALRRYFVHTRVLRTVGSDLSLCDPDFDAGCGYLSLLEVHILHRIVAAFPGRWFEAGTHTGWSAAYIAKAAGPHGRLLTCDPGFSKGAPNAMQVRATENLHNVGVMDRVTLLGITSEAFFKGWHGPEFNGVFIDGDHSGEHPVQDARLAMGVLKPDGVIVFHDVTWPGVEGVRRALSWLYEQGYAMREWKTIHGMAAVCKDKSKLDAIL